MGMYDLALFFSPFKCDSEATPMQSLKIYFFCDEMKHSLVMCLVREMMDLPGLHLGFPKP